MAGKATEPLSSSVHDWLLEPDQPSVRYLALRDLWPGEVSERELQKSSQAIMLHGTVPQVLDLQNPDGSWDIPEKFYTSKYLGSSWTVLLLAELGADPADARVRKACEFILNHAQHRESGGFAYAESARTGGGLASSMIPCLTGNMIYSLVKLGYLGDERVQLAINWLATVQRADDGDSGPPAGDIYKRLVTCWGKHSCHMGVAKAFKAFAAIPPDRRTALVDARIRDFAEYFLIHQIYKKSHDLDQVSRPGWLRLTFPLMYQTDILELLGIFAELNIHDPRLADAIQILRGKQQPDGRWILDNSFNGKMQVRIEHKGQPSKWLTLKALKVLDWYDNGWQSRYDNSQRN